MNKLDHLRTINKFISDYNNKINEPISERLNNMIESYYKSDKPDQDTYERILNNIIVEFNRKDNMENKE